MFSPNKDFDFFLLQLLSTYEIDIDLTHLLVIIIKSQEKIKRVKRCFVNFNLYDQNFAKKE